MSSARTGTTKPGKKLLATATVACLFWMGSVALAINPILPPTAFIPDGEPHVFDYKGEKRVFLYGSRDERVTAYCGYGHDVWSAPVNDLAKWTNHGEVFHVKQVQAIGFGRVNQQHFGAPDCAYNPVTRKYYLYTFLGAEYVMDGKQGPLPGTVNYVPGFENMGPKCVMAESDSPAGPFVNPVMCDWPPANRAGAFDPAVLVDEQADGSVRVYAYWGMMGGDRWAELDPRDMHTIIDGRTRKPDRNAWRRTFGDRIKGTSLFEASSIRKVAKDKYVFVYSAQERLCALSYCYGSSPQGPWTYGGRIIDNSNHWKGGNDHGSIANVNGHWYVFYHRATCNDFNRQAMAEPIDLTLEGDKVVIRPVEMTSQGVQAQGLDAFRRYYAGIVCYREGDVYIDGQGRSPDGLNPVVGIDQPRNLLGYKYLRFGEAKVTDADRLTLKLNLRLLRNASLAVQVALPEQANDPTKRVDIALFDLQKDAKADAGFREISVPIAGLDRNERLNAIGGLMGKLAVFLVFQGKGGELCRLKEIEFAKASRCRSGNSYLVVVDDHTYADATLRSKLDLYFQNVNRLFGFSATVVETPPFAPAAPGENIAAIRGIIQRHRQQQHISGVVLLGQIPYMIWRQAAGGNWVNYGPEDFYYADLDAAFQDRETRYGNGNSDILRPSGGGSNALDNQLVPGREHSPDGQYDTYLRGTHEGPALWVARIYAPTAQQYYDYFDKVNAYYRNIIEQLKANRSATIVPYKDILYTGHPNYAPSASSDKYRFFKEFVKSPAGARFFVFGENGGGTVAELFSNYNARAYLFAEVDGHANPYFHHLKNGAYSVADVQHRLTRGHGALIQALWGCHSGDFTGIKNGKVNLTFAYILSPGITQAAYGCSWTSGTEETEQEILKHMAQGDYLGVAFQKMQKRLYSKAYMEKFFAHEAQHVPNHFVPAKGPDEEKIEVLMTKLLRGYNLVGNPFVKIAYSNGAQSSSGK